MLLFLWACSSQPCDKALSKNTALSDIFQNISTSQCLHPQDHALLRKKMAEYHHQHTEHCEQIFRRYSLDGQNFDSNEELIVDHAQMADVWITKDGRHIISYVDMRPDLTATTAENDIQDFWKMGWVGWRGLGLTVDHMNGQPRERQTINLNLTTPLAITDPNIQYGNDRQWRLSFVGTQQENRQLYFTTSSDLYNFPTPTAFQSIDSDDSHSAWIDSELVENFIISKKRNTIRLYTKEAKPVEKNTRVRLSHADIFQTSTEQRIYGTSLNDTNHFQMVQSADGNRFSQPETVLKTQNASNISIAKDPVGIWWVYYNKTNEACVRQWLNQ